MQTAALLVLLASAPFLAAGQETVNLIATLVGATVEFTGDNLGALTVTLSGAEPIVSYQVTVPETHGGVWQLSQVAGKFVNGAWLGSPDGVVYAYNNYGEQVIILLGAVSNPSLNGNTLTFTTQILSPSDQLARSAGVANYVQAGKGGKLVTDPPSGPLNSAAIMLDLAIQYPPPGLASGAAATAQQEFDAITIAPAARRGPFTGRGGRG